MAGRISIDVRELQGLANRLGQIDGTTLAQVGVTALNEVAQRAEPTLRESIVATVNLTDAYVQARTGVRLATTNNLEAELFAPYRNTALGRYHPNVKLQRAKSNPKRLKGNPHLGIPVGFKPAKLSVEVTRGGRKDIQNPTAFLSPKQRDSDGNMFIFTRLTKNKRPLKARYGPAVYQLYRVAIDAHLDQVATDLELSLMAEAESAIDKAFE